MSKAEKAMQFLGDVATYSDTPAGAALIETDGAAVLATLQNQASAIAKLDGNVGQWLAAQIKHSADSLREHHGAQEAVEIIVGMAKRLHDGGTALAA